MKPDRSHPLFTKLAKVYSLSRGKQRELDDIVEHHEKFRLRHCRLLKYHQLHRFHDDNNYIKKVDTAKARKEDNINLKS